MGKLVFFDIETTGLDPRRDRILEVAAWTLEEATLEPAPGAYAGARFSACVAQIADPVEYISDRRVLEMHVANGLIEAVGTASYTVNEVERALLSYLREQGFRKGEAIIAGNSIHFDRGFLAEHMPDLHAFLSHRMQDVSAVGRFVRSAMGSHYEQPIQETSRHRAMGDVVRCVDEYRHYVRLVRAFPAMKET